VKSRTEAVLDAARIRQNPVVTYSIVAFDPTTGQLGVAVQSHFFNVGSVVPAALPGVGAVATQSFPNLQIKPRALAMLQQGRHPDEVVRELVADDPEADYRQFAIIDAQGRAAAHTGARCMAEAGHLVGDGFSVQANIMRSAAVWPAMAAAFESSRGEPLARRLLAALDAAEAAGGDLRGRQSAAILVVPAEGDEVDRVVDLRVEDATDPLGEMRRLLALNDAYRHGIEADAALTVGDREGAAAGFVRAMEAAPEVVELRFWAGLSLMDAGDDDRGVALVREAVAAESLWLELLRRLDPQESPSAARAVVLLGG
jgi:uncharacterized Ntn-hydrolase superfamily protein